MLLARIFFGDIEYNVIFNSVNLEKFAPKMSKNNDDLTFIHVGRYTYQKNQEFIIKIFQDNKDEELTDLIYMGTGRYYTKKVLVYKK